MATQCRGTKTKRINRHKLAVIQAYIIIGNLSTMKVSDGETETTYTDMVFIQQMEWADGTFYLAFREKTKEEKLVAALNATSNSITDVQMALAEVYEMVLGGN